MERFEHKKNIAKARHFLATVPGASDLRAAVARVHGITLAELDDDQS